MDQIANNGSGARPPARRADILPLPEHRVKAAEAFIANFQAREHELDTLKAALEEQQNQNRQLEIEIEGLRGQMAALESRAVTCQLQRDDAVAARADRETILTSIQHLLRQSGVPELSEPEV